MSEKLELFKYLMETIYANRVILLLKTQAIIAKKIIIYFTTVYYLCEK